MSPRIARKKSVGIIEVASKAGVSPATVSRVINNNPTVDPRIRDKVKKVITRLKYRPHLAARNLPRGLTGNIAIVTLRNSRVLFANPFFTRLFEGIGEVLNESSHNLMFSTSPGQMKRLLEAHVVDGVILVSIREDDPYIKDLEEISFPAVVVGGYPTQTRFTTICPDYTGGAILAVKHLSDLGHKKIGHLNGPSSSYKSQADQHGFAEAIRLFGIEEVGSIHAEEFIEQSAHEAFLKFMETGHSLPTAYVVSSDHLAIGLLKGAAECGISVPGDLSVVGFGDIPMASMLHPPLTTLHGDLVEMGAESARTLLEMIESGKHIARRIVYPLTIIPRGTTAPPRTEPTAI